MIQSNKAAIQAWIPTIAGVIIVILIGGGILAWQYFWVPKEVKAPEEKAPEEIVEDETANWKTYRNEEYGFEIKYPKEIEVSEYPSKISMLLPRETSMAIEKEFIIFWPEKPSKGECHDNWSLSRVTKTEEVYINEIKFLKEVGYDCDCDVPPGKGYAGACYCDPVEFITGKYAIIYSSKRYSTTRADYCFFFTLYLSPYNLSESDFEKESKIFDQMLSTFRFLE